MTLGANFDRMAAENPDDDMVPRGLEGFLESVHLSSDQDDYDEQADRVPIMTLHTAKGLEFPAVFIAGCEEGLLPHERSSQSQKEIEEERRLLFVGMTRAKEHLTLTHARFRRIRGQLNRCMMSPFLAEIPPETVQAVDETTGTRPEAFDPERRSGWDGRPARRGPAAVRGYSTPGPGRRIQPERDAETGLAVSEMVRHPTYGLGRVTGFTMSGKSRFVRVRFNTVGEKTLDPALAKLQKVSSA